ncbi:MAG: hypothetical protein CSA20_05485 [Deltaproteobacteria bacterium]|nr:MAG: hypothetical protein CSA20_05485 [Deltaproteobacteria bacterium]
MNMKGFVIVFMAVFPLIALPMMLSAADSGRCMRCGMVVAEQPQWEGRSQRGDEQLSYCSPKCLLLTNPADADAKDLTITVKDYYSTKCIDASQAWYVAGSDVIGPMGPDLVPFEKKEDAEAFMKEHMGSGLYPYSALTLAKIKELLPMKKHHKKAVSSD